MRWKATRALDASGEDVEKPEYPSAEPSISGINDVTESNQSSADETS